MELRQLRYFVAVAEERHFARAAARLHISGPSLSQQIAALERHLKVRLLDRSPRHVELTAAGEVVLQHARRSLAAERDLLEAVASLRSQVHATLRVGSLLAAPAAVSASMYRAFRSAFPNVLVHVRALGTTELIEPLLSGDIDIEFVWGPLEDSRIDCVRLFDAPRVMAVSRTNPLADAASLEVADVLDLTHGERVEGEPAEWEGFWNLVPERNGEDARRTRMLMSGDVQSQLFALALHDGALSLPAGMTTAYPGEVYGLRYVPVPDLAPAACSVAVRRDSAPALALRLRDIAGQVALDLETSLPELVHSGAGSATAPSAEP